MNIRMTYMDYYLKYNIQSTVYGLHLVYQLLILIDKL